MCACVYKSVCACEYVHVNTHAYACECELMCVSTCECLCLCVSVCASVSSVCVKPYNRHYGGTTSSGITGHTLVIWGTRQDTDKVIKEISSLIVGMCTCRRVNPGNSTFTNSPLTWVADTPGACHTWLLAEWLPRSVIRSANLGCAQTCARLSARWGGCMAIRAATVLVHSRAGKRYRRRMSLVVEDRCPRGREGAPEARRLELNHS